MENITSKEIKSYIENLYSYRNEFHELQKFARKSNIPIIKPDVEQFLKSILLLKQPQNILEIGTAIGYSSLIMKNMMRDASITTIEINTKLSRIANQYFQHYGYKDIKQINEDALIALQELEGPYDLIFIDAGKGHYLEYFKLVRDLVLPGGIILCDDVLYKGMVCKEEARIKRHRHITIVKRLHEFLEYLMEQNDFHTVVLPIDDGVSLSRKLN